MKRVFAWLTVCLLAGCLAGCGGEKRVVTSDTLYVPRIEGMTEAFILGMDASIVPSLEAGGVRYYDFDGKEKDVFEILSENGINYIRVRVWVDPYDGSGRGYGGGNCDIGTALAIGKRATRYGMKLLVDFHYSDFWADPGKQMVPKAWVGMEIDEKADALNRYTTDCLQQLKDAKVDVGMVQLGNETNGSLCGETAWGNICYLMESGSRAVRAIFPEALVAVHFTNPENANAMRFYAKTLDDFRLDYDVFATSYYPYWHGTLENLAAVLSQIAEAYGKKVMVAETSYAYTPEDTDFFGNTHRRGRQLCQTLSPYRTGTGRCRGGRCPNNGGGHDKRHRCLLLGGRMDQRRRRQPGGKQPEMGAVRLRLGQLLRRLLRPGGRGQILRRQRRGQSGVF